MTSRTVCVSNYGEDIPAISAQFVQKACEFKSSVLIEVDNKRYVNGKSFMGMLSLGVCKGMQLHNMSEGADEELAAEALERFFTA